MSGEAAVATDPVRGTVAAGFEPVAAAFARLLTVGVETGAALAVTVDGAPVVDIWGGQAAPGRPWRDDTLAVAFSASKALVALCAQILVDEGMLDIDAPVRRYWPDFAAEGKGDTLVGHLLDHRAGSLTFPRYWTVVGPDGHALADWAAMTGRLAAAPPSWPPGSRFRYHPVSFGYLTGEVVRRVSGVTVGRFFAERVARPLGLDLWIGLPPDLLDRVARVVPLDPAEQPRLARLERAAFARAEALVRAGREMATGALPYAEIFLHPGAPDPANHLYRLMSDPVLQMAEIPACNAIGTARALCGVYTALVAGGGGAAGLVSPATLARFTEARPLTASGSGAMGLGYQLASMAMLDPRGELRVRPGPGSFGHTGTGGALGFADPRHGVAIGYLKNRMHRVPAGTSDLVRAVYRCL